MPRRSPPPLADADHTIRQLLDDLFAAREAVISLVPEPLQCYLDASIWVYTSDDLRAWKGWAVDRITAAAAGRAAGASYPPARQRTACPLCGGAPQSGVDGFGLPI